MRLALKWIKRLVITLIIICLAYSIAWFIILNLISRELNKQYSGQAINTTNIGVKEQYVLKFSKIEAVGFPFKISFKILNWHEESRTSQISFSAPIYVGYDLLKQHIFIAFSGDIIAKYKPLESGFGARFRVANQEFLIKYPITMRLIKVLLNKNNPFEVVNFIKSFESSSGNIQIFDLVDNEKFYEEDHLSFKLLIN
jgi:hypothetical protein